MAYISFGLQFERQFSGPLDIDAVFNTTAALNAYLTVGRRFAGQIATCLDQPGKLFILSNDRSQWLEFSEDKALGDITDITITNPQNGQTLVYQNGAWSNTDVSVLAADVSFDNQHSGLLATNVQSAIDELNGKKLDITALSSNVILYATTAASDISGYVKMVTSPSDPSYNTTPVGVSTGTITGQDQLIASLASEPGIIVGNPGIINIVTIGNIAKTSGNQNDYAEFYYKVFKRDSLGNEQLIATSDTTGPVNPNVNSVYQQFGVDALLNNGTFVSTDRIVIKYYANLLNGAPVYAFEFGGNTPVRTLLPVPISAVVQDQDASQVITVTSGFNGILSAANDNVQSALDTLDDHNHDSRYYTETETDTLLSAKADLVDGKIPSNQIPSLALTEVYTVSSLAEQLALVAQKGDVAIRTDLSISYIHNGGTAGTIADWTELKTPTDAVLSVNGEVGAVSLDFADVGALSATDARISNWDAAYGWGDHGVEGYLTSVEISDINATGTAASDTFLAGDGAWKQVATSVNGETGTVQLTNADIPLEEIEATGSITLALSDGGKLIRFTSATGSVVTIPTDASVNFPAGTEILVNMYGAGPITFQAATGVTMNYIGETAALTQQYTSALLRKVAEDEWLLVLPQITGLAQTDISFDITGTNNINNVLVGSLNVGDLASDSQQNVVVGKLVNTAAAGSRNVLVGYQAQSASSSGTTNDTVVIGQDAQTLSSDSVVIGSEAKGWSAGSTVIGKGAVAASATPYATVVGHLAGLPIGDTGSKFTAIGYMAQGQGSDIDNSIQLGEGTVTAANKFQVWGYEMLDKTTGLIPSERISGGVGASSLGDLTDVTLGTPAENDLLYFNGFEWVNIPITGSSSSQSFSYDLPAISDTDFTLSSPGTYQYSSPVIPNLDPNTASFNLYQFDANGPTTQTDFELFDYVDYGNNEWGIVFQLKFSSQSNVNGSGTLSDTDFTWNPTDEIYDGVITVAAAAGAIGAQFESLGPELEARGAQIDFSAPLSDPSQGIFQVRLQGVAEGELGTFTADPYTVLYTLPDTIETFSNSVISLEWDVQTSVPGLNLVTQQYLQDNEYVKASEMPAIAITSTSVVADLSERDNLSVQEGDVAIVTGESKTFIWDGSQWQEMLTPSGGYSTSEVDTLLLGKLDVSEFNDHINSGVVEQSTSKTLESTDANKMIKATQQITLTIPLDSNYEFPINTEIVVVQYGTGEVTIAAESGVTLNSADSKTKILGQYSSAVLKKMAADEWLLIGALTN